jgi:hypothetical protein
MDNRELVDWLSEQIDNLDDTLRSWVNLREELRKIPVQIPWDRDITSELARNPGPYTSSHLQADNGWWRRTLDMIDAVTIHHTLSDSPHATARHYVDKSGGRPSIPYTIWITQTGEVLLCVPLEEGLWHDHTCEEPLDQPCVENEGR